MSKVTRIIGFMWAAPLTVLGVIYASLFTLFGWYQRLGTFGDALVWIAVPDHVPGWVKRTLLWWGGHTLGNVVVLLTDPKSDRGKIILRHEQEHVHQSMVMGVFQPVLYGLISLSLRFCRHAHHHFDNPFEIDCRRAAGQVVDVNAVLMRAAADGRLKAPIQKLIK